MYFQQKIPQHAKRQEHIAWEGKASIRTRHRYDIEFLKKLEAKRIFLTSLHKASITLIPKTDKDIIRNKTHRPIQMQNFSTKILPNQIWHCIKKELYNDQVVFIPSEQGSFETWKSISMIHQIKRLQRKIICSCQMTQKKHLIKSNTYS